MFGDLLTLSLTLFYCSTRQLLFLSPPPTPVNCQSVSGSSPHPPHYPFPLVLFAGNAQLQLFKSLISGSRNDNHLISKYQGGLIVISFSLTLLFISACPTHSTHNSFTNFFQILKMLHPLSYSVLYTLLK